MDHLTITPRTLEIRVYDQPGGYEKRLPYLGIVTVTHLTDKIAYVHSAVGRVTRANRSRAFAMLAARGITTLMYERHGRMKTIDLPAPAAQFTEQ